MTGYPENHYCFSNRSPAFLCKSSMIFMIKRYQKNMKDMRYNDYPSENAEKETWVPEDPSNLI